MFGLIPRRLGRHAAFFGGPTVLLGVLTVVVGTAGWFFFYAIFALTIRRNDAFNTVTSIFYFVFLFASSMFCRASASVVANAVWPCLSMVTKKTQVPAVGAMAACSASLPGLEIGPIGIPATSWVKDGGR